NVISIKAQAIKLLKEQFESYSGIKYETLDKFTNINLTIDMRALNTLINIAKAQTDVNKEALRLIQEETNGLYVDGSLSSNIGLDVTTSATATYSFKNYSFSSGLSGTYNYSTKVLSPYVTVAATYSSESNTKSKSLKILAAENLVQKSNLDYQDAIANHSLTVFSLQNNIQESNLELQQFEIERSVNTQSLANTQTLYDNGFATDTELTKAKNLCALDTINEQQIKLARLIIKNNIDKEFL
ncbi:MAG: hypothetical protein JJE21_03960, partial [Spirochaetaceae bacterium]|nr:hypothetical protein [Spirochaetaceae bacterium]